MASALVFAGTALSSAQVLYVSSIQNKITQISTATQTVTQSYVSLSGAAGLAVNANLSSDNLAASSTDGATNTVYHILRDSATSGSAVSYATGLPIYIGALTYDNNGNLWAAALGNNTAPIGMVTADTYTPISITPFHVDYGAQSLAFDTAGNLYVANGVNGSEANTIQKLIPPSEEGGIWTATTFAAFDSGANPFGMTFDDAGNLYVSLFGLNSVAKISADGLTVDANFATGLNQPAGLVFADGSLYEADFSGGYINKIELDGTVTPFAYTGNNNNQIVFSAVPEPSAISLAVVAGLGFLLVLQRRQRKLKASVLLS